MLRRLVQLTQLVTLGIAAACVVLLFTAQPPPPPPMVVSSPGSTVDPLTMGEVVYESQCESCHGTWGEGVYAPVTIDKAASLAKYPDPAVQASLVAAGKGQMPAFGGRLTPEQIDAVVVYIRQLT